MADLNDSDDDKQHLTDDNGADWETAPEDFEVCSDDALSDRSKDNGHSDGDFEDAWLDDYLLDAADSMASKKLEDENESIRSLQSRRAFMSKVEELKTTPSLMVVDATGKPVLSLSSPKLAGFKALESNGFMSEQIKGQRSESCAPALIHPIADTISLNETGKSSSLSRISLTPLSPSSLPYKRANTLCFSPPSVTTTKFFLSNDYISSGMTRPPQVSDLDDTTKRTSLRYLDEWKRKEMWQDLKRAEENLVTSSCSSNSDELSPSSLSKSKSTATDGRFDDIITTLQSELALPLSHGDSLAQQQNGHFLDNTSMSENLLTANVPSEDTHEGKPSVTPQTSVVSSMTNSLLSSQPMFTTITDLSPQSPLTPVLLSRFEQLQVETQHLQRNLQQKNQTLQNENQLLRAEIEKVRDDSADDHKCIKDQTLKFKQLNERIKQLNEKLIHLDAVERENRQLKEMTQNRDIQAVSTNEFVKTLSDQLALTTKSEEQLKLQIKQLLEQNHSLQTDLLEKIACETTKFQNLAKLSAENESLTKELVRKDHVSKESEFAERRRLQCLVVYGLLRLKRQDTLRSVVFKWSRFTQITTLALTRALTLIYHASHDCVVKLKAAAFRKLCLAARNFNHESILLKFQWSLDAAKKDNRAHCIMLGMTHLNRLLDNCEHRQTARSFSTWRSIRHVHVVQSRSFELGLTKLRLLLNGQKKVASRKALLMLHFKAAHDRKNGGLERLHQAEKNLTESKECIFSLSRAKVKLEDKLQSSCNDVQRLAEKVVKNASELQLAKHSYVATVIRDIDRKWLRSLLSQWRIQTVESIAVRELQSHVKLVELKAAEQEKYSKSLDDCNRVLRSDLERFQFFSLDKQITVDALSKKLLREEERYRRMEERNVMLEEKANALKTQLASYVESDGLVLPLNLLVLCKDVAMSNLRELFQLYATSDSAVAVDVGRIGDRSKDVNLSPRLALASFVRMLECSSLLQENVVQRESLAEHLAKSLPSYAVESGLLFADFINGLNEYLTKTFLDSKLKHEQLKRFWASLLFLLEAFYGRRCGAAEAKVFRGVNVSGTSGNGPTLLLCPSRASWAGRLSDDILQNRDKLLAVLEHETAVVERAVMEKASLKHTYQTSELTLTGSVSSSPFVEYQCDPLLPPGSPSHSFGAIESENTTNLALHDAGSNFTSSEATHGISMEVYSNWHLIPQVRDLFLALRTSTLKLVVQYSSGQHSAALGSQHYLLLTAVIRMLTDFKLHPTILTRERVQSLFNRFRVASDIEGGFLTPQGFSFLLGSCAFELYARSLTSSQKKPHPILSAREILLTFFGDLGLLAESDIFIDARLFIVGIDAEAILWPLFEYYANAADSAPNKEGNTSRIGINVIAFDRFMMDIGGKLAEDPRTLFCRVMQNSSKYGVKEDLEHWRMRLDEFYVAISYIQNERSPGTAYARPGEAVRQWLKQSQEGSCNENGAQT
ncbi:hypothetical protein Plhal304r1_c007g0028611 [Plasmopara halstedii]